MFVKPHLSLSTILKYDNGRLTKSIEGSVSMFYAYTGSSTLFQNQASASTDYVFANGFLVAKLVSGSTVDYYHSDVLGSIRLVTSSTGSVVFADGYQPYGQDNGTPSGTEAYRFTGKPVSQTTGLYYEYQRWYDPSIGRFISRDMDPGNCDNPQSMNGYSYVLNNPTRLVDPDGARAVDAFYRLLEGIFAAQPVLHGYSYLGTYSWGPNGALKTRWGPGSPFSSYMHTTVIIDDLKASGKARQYWKYDLEPGGGRSGWWDSSVAAMDHPDAYSPWLGRAAAAEGYFSRIGGLVGLAFSAYDIANAVSTDWSEGGGLRHTIPAVTHEAFGWAGALVGAEAFGEAGAAIGSLFGPPGIVVGGLVGGLIGGGLGFFCGSQVGDWVGNQLVGLGPGAGGLDIGSEYFGGGVVGR